MMSNLCSSCSSLITKLILSDYFSGLLTSSLIIPVFLGFAIFLGVLAWCKYFND